MSNGYKMKINRMNDLYRFSILVLITFISAEANGLCLDGKRSSVNSEFNGGPVEEPPKVFVLC